MDYIDSTDSMSSSFFITDPETYTELLTNFLEHFHQLAEQEKRQLPQQLIILLDDISQSKTLKNAQLIMSHFLNNFKIYAESSLEGIAFFLDTSFFRACKILYDQELILNTSNQGELNFTAVLTHKNIGALTPVLELLVKQGIIDGSVAQRNFNLIIQHANLSQLCSALIEEKTSCLKHEIIRTHFEWITKSQEPKYLIKILSILDESQLITIPNGERVMQVWEGDLERYASLLALLHQHKLLHQKTGQTNFIKIMAYGDPTFLSYALSHLVWLFQLNSRQISLNMLLEHQDPIELGEAIQILGRKSLLFKINIHGKYAEEYLAQHPAPWKLARAFTVLYKTKAITATFLNDNILTLINHPEPYYLMYSLYLINRAGLLTYNHRQLAAQHQDDAEELFNILDILTRKKIIKANSDGYPPGLSPQNLISQLLAHQQIKGLAKCLRILYEGHLIHFTVGKIIIKELLQHPNLDYFSNILSTLTYIKLLPSPLSLPESNHHFWVIARHKNIKSLSRNISLLSRANLLDQANLNVLLAHKKNPSLVRALTSLNQLFAVNLLSGRSDPLLSASTVAEQRQDAFNYLAGYPGLKGLSKILSRLTESVLFNSLQGLTNIKLLVNYPHSKILLTLLSQLSNKGIFHKKNAPCFFDAVIQHPNPFYLYEALSHFTSLKGINKLTIKDAFILAMNETGYTFSETKTAFSKSTHTLFYPKSRLAQTMSEECIVILRNGGF